MNQAQANYYNAQASQFNTRLGLYAGRKKDYDKLAFQYNQAEQEYQKYHQEFKEQDLEVTYQRGCTIILADKTELNANEVAASEKHDLVLLKLEGYQTPFIKPGNAKRLGPGRHPLCHWYPDEYVPFGDLRNFFRIQRKFYPDQC